MESDEDGTNTSGPDNGDTGPELNNVEGDVEDEDEDTEALWLAKHGPVALQLYKDVWNEFYTYEIPYCQSTINLSRGYHSIKSYRPEPYQHRPVQSYKTSNPNSQRFKIEDFDEDESAVRISYVYTDPSVVGRDSSVSLDPYPRYTTCTSGVHNVLPTDPDMHKRAKFYPHADEREFAEQSPDYLEDYENFAWQDDFVDPDLEMIEIEAARRLHYAHNYTYEEIDRFDMFQRTMGGKGGENLIWHASQRDQFRWPGASLGAHLPLSTISDDTNLSFYDEVTRDLINFCPRLGCCTSFCKMHDKALPIIPPKVTTTSEKMRNGKRKPCERECYKNVDIENMDAVNDHWDDVERSLFQSVFKLAPDTYPCDLAVICRKPCYETYIERLSTISDDQIETETFKEARPSFTFADPKDPKDPKPYVFAETASGHAPTKDLVAGQYAHAMIASITVRDPVDVPQNVNSGEKDAIAITRRKRKITDHVRTIPNSPVLVQIRTWSAIQSSVKDVMLGARHGKCQNMKLQRGDFVRIRIKPSKYGLGAFATKSIKSGSYIGEYVGERLHDNAAHSVVALMNYSHLNYTFGYTHEVLDSWRFGNETRYLNDSKPEMPNCNARLVLVDGEPRIAIEACTKIAAGEELFLSYGETYWQGNE